mgnify:CR=1 FL=1
MERQFVFKIEEIADPSIDKMGTKGYYLWILHKNGFKIPKTYILDTSAYELFVKENNLEESFSEIENILDEKALEEALEKLREKIMKSTIPCSIKNEIEQIVCDSGIDKFAIRSSATGEDLPYVSFAGMYDTYLNVLCEQVIEYVKKVWASLWNLRAVKYRNQIGIKDVKMAVILQEFIPAEKSGVAFSADVVKMDPGVVVINTSFGLGEGIVSGQVEVDTYYVDKFKGEVKEKILGEKKHIIVPKDEGGTKRSELDPNLRDVSVLEDQEIKDIASNVFDIEKLYKAPIDVEWVIHSGDLYIVQTRPITTFENIYGYYDIEWHDYDNLETIWTNVNIGELMPGIVKPLSWSIMKINIDYGFREPFAYLPYLKKPINFTRLFLGRAYLNYDALRAIPSILPGGSAEIMDELYLGGLPFEKTPEPKAKGLKAAEYMIRMIRDMNRKKKEANRLIPLLDKKYKEFLEKDLSKLSFDELVELHKNFDEIFGERHAFAIHIGCSAYALPNINLLREKILELGVDLNENPLDKNLLLGLTDMESAMASAKLWDLAQMVIEDSALLELFKFRKTDEVLEEVTRSKDRFQAFLNVFNEFMREFGHRCVGEFKLENPRWMEEPLLIIEMIKHYVETKASSPYELIEKQREIREKAERELIKIINERIRNPIKKKYIKSILNSAQAFVRYRENMKTALVKLSYIRRKIILEIARRLKEKGVLSDVNDIFYLTNRELIDLLESKITPQIANMIIDRRKEIYKTLEDKKPPNIIIGYLRPEHVITEERIEKPAENVLKGIPGSPGIYRGTARIINNPREFHKLKKGDVLVAPATDLGWTPLYLISGAIVIEIGSVLSHGAIIAREYGIPAVMNVKNATKIIKDGDIVEVDGTNGEVRIIQSNKS